MHVCVCLCVYIIYMYIGILIIVEIRGVQHVFGLAHITNFPHLAVTKLCWDVVHTITVDWMNIITVTVVMTTCCFYSFPVCSLLAGGLDQRYVTVGQRSVVVPVLWTRWHTDIGTAVSMCRWGSCLTPYPSSLNTVTCWHWYRCVSVQVGVLPDHISQFYEHCDTLTLVPLCQCAGGGLAWPHIPVLWTLWHADIGTAVSVLWWGSCLIPVLRTLWHTDIGAAVSVLMWGSCLTPYPSCLHTLACWHWYCCVSVEVSPDPHI